MNAETNMLDYEATKKSINKKHLIIVFSIFFILLLSVIVFLLSNFNPSSHQTIPEYVINAMNELKSSLKDPESMRLYGDVYFMNADNENLIFDLYYDAKNSYGGYTGKKRINYVISSDSEFSFTIAEDGSDGLSHLDIQIVYDGAKKLFDEENDIIKEIDTNILYQSLTNATIGRIDGKSLSLEIGCDFFEYDW